MDKNDDCTRTAVTTWTDSTAGTIDAAERG